MKIVPIRWCALLLLLGVHALSAQNLDSLLVYPWNVVEYQKKGEEISRYGIGDQDKVFIFKGDHTFQLQLDRKYEGFLEETGRWRIRNDSLLLFHELLPQERKVDSLVYEAAQNQGRLRFYAEGEEVAELDMKGFSSERRVEALEVVVGADHEIMLKGEARSMVLRGRPVLIKTSFEVGDLFRGSLGVVCMLLLAWLMSSNRRAVDWRLVGTGLGLQLVFALLVLKVSWVSRLFQRISGLFVDFLNYSREGADFLFSGLVSDIDSFGYIFAFQVLPTIVFFSAVMSIFYYLGILQKVVYAFAWIMSKTMRLSGAESLAAAGNVFLGQTESPLLIRPYLDKMTRSEIMSLMTGGMATIAGSVFAAYVGYLGGSDPAQQLLFATHLLTASVMSAPAAIVAAKIMVPETEPVNQNLLISREKIGSNLLDAIANGTTDGLRLAVNVGVMLLVFTALVALANGILADFVGEATGLNQWVNQFTNGKYDAFNLQFLFGLLCAPIAWLLGVPSEDVLLVGQLLGEKTIINEFYAYATLGEFKTGGDLVYYKSIIIATYALCGFANFASIGIQIGGIGALAPDKRRVLSELGVRSLIGGTLACFITAAIAGMIAAF